MGVTTIRFVLSQKPKSREIALGMACLHPIADNSWVSQIHEREWQACFGPLYGAQDFGHIFPEKNTRDLHHNHTPYISILFILSDWKSGRFFGLGTVPIAHDLGRAVSADGQKGSRACLMHIGPVSTLLAMLSHWSLRPDQRNMQSLQREILPRGKLRSRSIAGTRSSRTDVVLVLIGYGFALQVSD